jgi:hypothetical protein
MQNAYLRGRQLRKIMIRISGKSEIAETVEGVNPAYCHSLAQSKVLPIVDSKYDRLPACLLFFPPSGNQKQ